MVSELVEVAAAKAGDQAAMARLIDRYAGLAATLAADFYDRSASPDDLRQEALIGVWKAVRDYRPDGGLSFRNFVTLVVRRQVITAVKTATRVKHQQLTTATRVTVTDEGDELAAVDLVEAVDGDPYRTLERKEQLALVADWFTRRLSPLERDVAAGLMNGLTYIEIARLHGLPVSERQDNRARSKPVDNALMRARKKLNVLLEADQFPLDVAA